MKSKRSEIERDAARPMSDVTAAFLEHGAFLKRFLGRLLPTRQDIEDVAQEAYLRAYLTEQCVTIEQPKAFLFRVAKNLALTRLTRKSHQITDYLEEAGYAAVQETEPAIDMQLEAQQSFGLYCEAVAALPEKCRQVFLLRKVHGLPHRDIAARLDLSISSVEKYLRQGILACNAHLKRYEDRPKDRRPNLARKRGDLNR